MKTWGEDIASEQAAGHVMASRIDKNLLRIAPPLAMLAAFVSLGDAYLCWQEFTPPGAMLFVAFNLIMAGIYLGCSVAAARCSTAAPVINRVVASLILGASLHGLAKLCYTRDSFYYGGVVLLLAIAGSILTTRTSYLIVAVTNVAGGWLVVNTIVPSESEREPASLAIMAVVGFTIITLRQRWHHRLETRIG